MIIEYIRYTLKQEDPGSFALAFKAAGGALIAAPECLGYDVSQCAEDERSFIVRIRWTSLAAHLEGFRQGPHFPPFLKHVQPFIPDIVEMRHYQVIAEAEPHPSERTG